MFRPLINLLKLYQALIIMLLPFPGRQASNSIDQHSTAPCQGMKTKLKQFQYVKLDSPGGLHQAQLELQ